MPCVCALRQESDLRIKKNALRWTEGDIGTLKDLRSTSSNKGRLLETAVRVDDSLTSYFGLWNVANCRISLQGGSV